MFLQGSSSSQNGGSAPPAGTDCQGAPVGCGGQQTQRLRLGEQAGLLYQRQRQPIPLRQRQQPRLLRLGQQAQLLQSAQESRRSSSALALAQAVLATAKKTYRRELQAPAHASCQAAKASRNQSSQRPWQESTALVDRREVSAYLLFNLRPAGRLLGRQALRARPLTSGLQALCDCSALNSHALGELRRALLHRLDPLPTESRSYPQCPCHYLARPGTLFCGRTPGAFLFLMDTLREASWDPYRITLGFVCRGYMSSHSRITVLPHQPQQAGQRSQYRPQAANKFTSQVDNHLQTQLNFRFYKKLAVNSQQGRIPARQTTKASHRNLDSDRVRR